MNNSKTYRPYLVYTQRPLDRRDESCDMMLDQLIIKIIHLICLQPHSNKYDKEEYECKNRCDKLMNYYYTNK